MEATKGQSSTAPPQAPTTPNTSCRRKKKDDATFLEDLKDHIDEFIHASMDEHKSCFKKTIDKMFSMSKIVAERNSSPAKEGVESSLPLKTTLSEETSSPILASDFRLKYHGGARQSHLLPF